MIFTIVLRGFLERFGGGTVNTHSDGCLLSLAATIHSPV